MQLKVRERGEGFLNVTVWHRSQVLLAELILTTTPEGAHIQAQFLYSSADEWVILDLVMKGVVLYNGDILFRTIWLDA